MTFIFNSPNSCLETIQHLIYFENVSSMKNRLHLVTMGMESKSTVYNRLLVQYFSSHSKLYTYVLRSLFMLSFKMTQHATLEVTPLYKLALIINIHFLCLIIEYSVVQGLCLTYLHMYMLSFDKMT